jgi:hypothetical protein
MGKSGRKTGDVFWLKGTAEEAMSLSTQIHKLYPLPDQDHEKVYG